MAPQGVAETAPVALLLRRAPEEAGLGRRRWCGALRACGPHLWAPCGGRVCLSARPAVGSVVVPSWPWGGAGLRRPCVGWCR